MPSPFPGMDPYLEGYLWPDVHAALAGKIRQILAPLLRPKYTARLGVYVVEDAAPEGEIGIMYPDVEVLANAGAEPSGAISAGSAAPTPSTLTLPVVLPVEVAVPGVEIHDTASNQLITAIKIISPVNKRDAGLTAYRRKRHRLYQAGVHLVEVDLLRRGARPVDYPHAPLAPYLVAVTRANEGTSELWSVRLDEELPTIPVPLHPPDDDVAIPLSQALQLVYDEAAYELSIDYSRAPPPPPLSEEQNEWMRRLLKRP